MPQLLNPSPERQLESYDRSPSAITPHDHLQSIKSNAVRLNHFYTDSDGNTVENPRCLRKAEKELKRLTRRVSCKKKGSNNRKKAIKRLGKKHLKVSRQRKDFAFKL